MPRARRRRFTLKANRASYFIAFSKRRDVYIRLIDIADDEGPLMFDEAARAAKEGVYIKTRQKLSPVSFAA